MKILFLSTRSPLKAVDGGSVRTSNLFKIIAAKHETTVVAFIKHLSEYDSKDQLSLICNESTLLEIEENHSKFILAVALLKNIFSSKPFIEAKYDKVRMRNRIRSILALHQIDLIHIDGLPLACYFDMFKEYRVVLNSQNVETLILARRVACERNPVSKLFYQIQQKRLEKFEKRAFMLADEVLVCSNNDKALVEQMAPGCSTTVVPNGVDINYFTPVDVTPSLGKLVFVGGMDWFPNLDAVTWFDREILPILREQSSSVMVHVVGRNEKKISLLHPDNFVFHGFVDDIREHVADAVLFLCPLRVGGGTRLKLLDAMAMGKAIVSTTIGAEGLNVEHQEQMLLADTPEAFSEAILTLLSDQDLRNRLAASAREFVVKNYSWGSIGNILLDAYECVARRPVSQKAAR